MEWWIKEEIDKYKSKEVSYMNSTWKVKDVVWRSNSEEFVYYIENSKGDLQVVFENNIQLIK